ncbi:hypothetical protein [Budvicia diplopodorum]|uniref:hypothetical protein n=1 Tax=Budvicia diplopodorum TaxID=1119056 RepID=UPI001358948D|nr:hypothetical protein [Budvicia diplopodorum]
MPVIFVVFIQILCGVHAIKSDQERYWLYLIIGLPGIGCAIYALGVMLPNALRSRDGHRLVNHAYDKIDPERYIRMLRDELEITQTSQNYVLLADELARVGRPQEAVEEYKNALTGIFTHDPDIMVKMAHAQFDSHDSVSCQSTLEAVIVANPSYQSQDGHLLYARALAENRQFAKAEEEYQVLIDYYSGPEARYRYYQLLQQQGNMVAAKQQLETIQLTARRAKPHYRKLHKAWLSKVNQEMKSF